MERLATPGLSSILELSMQAEKHRYPTGEEVLSWSLHVVLQYMLTGRKK